MNVKWIVLLIVGVFVAIVALLIALAVTPRATIILSIAPAEGTVTIDGKKNTVKNGDKLTVKPGDVSVEFSRDEFTTVTQKISIKNGETKELFFVLDALTPAAQKLLNTPGAERVIEGKTGKRAAEAANQTLDTYPIFKDLPINDKFYSIIQCPSEKYPEDKTKYAVCVKLYDPQAKEAALNEITRRGYKLEDYEVITLDFSYQVEGQD